MKRTGILVSVTAYTNFLLANSELNGAHEGSWMDKWLLSYDFGLTFWTILTFFVVLIVLKWKAWGPLMNALDNRERNIKEQLESADKAREEAEKISQDYDEMIRKARVEAQQIITDGKAVGEKMKSEIESSARKNADKILVKAKSQIESEKEKALKDIRSTVVDLSIKAASRVIGKNLDAKDNQKIVDDTINKVGQA